MPVVDEKVGFRGKILSTYTHTEFGSGTLVTTNSDREYLFSTTCRRETQVNPNWRERVRLGLDVSSPYFRRVVGVTPARIYGRARGFPYGWNYRAVEYNSNYRGVFFDTNIDAQLFLGDDTVLRDQALTRLKRKLSNRTKSVNVLVPLAEIRELHGMVRGIASSATELVTSLIDIRKTRGKSAYKYAAEKWLLWSFAISPTIAEINSISDAIDTYLHMKDHMFRNIGKAERTWVTSWHPGVTTGMYGADLERRYRLEHKLSYLYGGGFATAIRAGNNYGLGPQFGLEFGALIPTAWELVPYSWLIDYFTTVGAFLDDVFVSDSCQTRYLFMNRRYECNVELSTRFVKAQNTFFLDENHKKGSFYVREFRRTPLSSLPVANLRFKSLDEVGRNAVNRLLNLTSLLAIRR